MSDFCKFVDAWCEEHQVVITAGSVEGIAARKLLVAIEEELLPLLAAKLVRQVNVLYCDPFLPKGFVNAGLHDDRPGFSLYIGGREVIFNNEFDAMVEVSLRDRKTWDITKNEEKK